MHLFPPMFLAYGNSSVWDIVVWFVVGAIWLVSQMAAAKKKQEQKNRLRQSPPASSPAALPEGGRETPTPAELAEIFKRLGADIPATPPPPAPPRTSPTPAVRIVHKSAQTIMKKQAAARIQPVLAQRLARARQEAQDSANQAEAGRAEKEKLANAIVPGVQSRAGENRALDTATRHTGAILPRLYAMSFRMAPLPSLPMPGLDRTHHVTLPMRTRLHTRREIRDALIAQTFLQPAKGFSR